MYSSVMVLDVDLAGNEPVTIGRRVTNLPVVEGEVTVDLHPQSWLEAVEAYDGMGRPELKAWEIGTGSGQWAASCHSKFGPVVARLFAPAFEREASESMALGAWDAAVQAFDRDLDVNAIMAGGAAYRGD